MSCLDEQQVLDFLAGALDRPSRERALKHLDGCPTCREVLATLARSRRPGAAQPATEQVASLFQPTVLTPALGSVGKYRLERKLGEGGMAEVYLATQLGPGGFERRCVVKLPRQHDAEFRSMFLAEAKVLAAVEHPNVARVLELGVAGGRLFLAMEYVEGRDLQQVIASYRRDGAHVPLEASLEVVRQAALGLDAAHAAIEAHRDVSPQNLMLARDGTVKVIDFGLARSGWGERTAAGVVKGKPRYFSPEQARNAPLDARTDVFSLGLVLYELLTSERAYDDEDPSSLFRRAVVADVPARRPAHVPAEVWAVYRRCTAREADARYRSMAELADVIEGLGLAGGRAATAALAVRSAKALSEGEKTQPIPRR